MGLSGCCGGGDDSSDSEGDECLKYNGNEEQCGGAASSSSIPQGVVSSLMNGEMALPHTDHFPLPSPFSCPGGCQEAFYCRFDHVFQLLFSHVLDYVCCLLMCCLDTDIVEHAQRQTGKVLILYSALVVRGLNQYPERLLESLLNILMV